MICYHAAFVIATLPLMLFSLLFCHYYADIFADSMLLLRAATLLRVIFRFSAMLKSAIDIMLRYFDAVTRYYAAIIILRHARHYFMLRFLPLLCCRFCATRRHWLSRHHHHHTVTEDCHDIT